MTPSCASHSFADGQSKEMQELVEKFLARLEAGEKPNLEEFLRAHPDQAEQLRGLLTPIQLLEEMGRSHPLASDAQNDETKRILGDYRILREVGRGGMGIVLEARQISLDRRVALKVLPITDTSTRQLKRFENEARAAASLEHPNIVPVYGVGCERGVHFFAMRFIEGETLADFIARQGSPSTSDPTASYTPDIASHNTLALSADTKDKGSATHPGSHAQPKTMPSDPAYFRRVVKWIIQAADALDYAHSAGIVHRDVKPGNLMIDRDDKLWVTDFGLARFGTETGLTLSSDVVGTLRYMSPEQARATHGAVDYRTDVYSLGATLYELLTLQPVIDGRDRQELLRKIALQEPARLRKLNDAVPRDLETIAHKALEKYAGDRYNTARQMAEDLQRWEQDRPILAKPPGIWIRTRKFLRRHQAVATTIGVAAFLLLTGAIGILGASNVRIREEEKAKGEALAAKSEALGKSEKARRELAVSLRESAKLAMGQGITLGEQGDAGRGLLWLAHALKILPSGSDDLDRIARANLDSWGRALHPLHAVIDYTDTEGRLKWAFALDGKTMAVREKRSTVSIWDMVHGRRIGTPLEHPNNLADQVFTPEGTMLITLSHKGTREKSPDAQLRRWDARSGDAIGMPISVPGAPKRLILSPDGALAVTASDGVVYFWDLHKGLAKGLQIAWTPEIEFMAFTPDGRRLVTVGKDPKNRNGFEVQTWDAATGKSAGPALSSNGRLQGFDGIDDLLSVERQRVLISTKGKGARIHDLFTGNPLGDIIAPQDLQRARFSPDGALLGLDSERKTLRVWHAATGKLHATLTQPATVERVQFRFDGKQLLIAGADNVVRFLNLETGKAEKTVLSHPATIRSVAYSPDGAYVVTGAGDNLARIWQMENGKILDPPIRHEGTVVAEFAPLGRFILTHSSQGYGDLGRLRLWEVNGVRADKVFHVDREVLAFSRDGKSALVGNKKGAPLFGGKHAARLVDLETGKALGPELLQPQKIEIGAIAPDGTTVATGYYANEKVERRSLQRGFIQLWNGRTGKALSLALFHEQSIGEEGLSFSADGTLVLSCDYSGHAHVWDSSNGDRRGAKIKHHIKEEEGTEPLVDAVALSPDGKTLATGAWDKRVCLWDRATGKLLHAIEHPNYVFSVAFSPDGRSLATGCGDNRARLFDVSSGKQVGPPLVHHGRGSVSTIVFSPDGRYVLTASQDDTVRLWIAETGRPVGPFLPQSPVEAQVIGISADGQTILTASIFTVRTWPMPRPRAGAPERIELWAQVRTGMELDEYGVIRWLDTATWLERRERLETMMRPKVP